MWPKVRLSYTGCNPNDTKENELSLIPRKRFWLGLLLSLAFLGLFVARTDFGEIGDAFLDANYLYALAAVPLYFIGFWVRAIRWRCVMRPIADVSTARLYPVVLIGLMANNVAPARVGELVRAYLVGRRESMSKSTALGTIAVDRAFDGLTLVAILGIVTSLSGTSSGVKLLGILTALAFFVATAILSFLALSPRARLLLGRLLTLLPASVSGRVEEILDSFLTGLAALRNPMVLLLAGITSFASWLIEGVMYAVIGLAFDLHVGFDVYLLILAAANLALAIIALPGGVGPFEAASQSVLHSFGVGAGQAAAYTLVLHALLLGPVILVGFVLLGTMHLSLGQLMGGGPPSSRPPGGGKGSSAQIAAQPHIE